MVASAFITSCSTTTDTTQPLTSGDAASIGVSASAADIVSAVPSTTSEPLGETLAALRSTGFKRCDGTPTPDGLTRSQREDILDRVMEAGLAQGGGTIRGQRVALDLDVLDWPTLTELAELIDPELVCVRGQDAADYVEPGPQLERGPGWRFLGSATITVEIPISVATSDTQYDEIWQAFSVAHPHLADRRPAVDFEREIVIAIDTEGRGISVGACGSRFDGFRIDDELIDIDFFSPGGEATCPASYDRGTFLVALERHTLPEPWRFAIRRGPRLGPRLIATADAGDMLAWPLARLMQQVWEHLEDVPVDPILANGVECRLFEGRRDTPLIAPESYPPALFDLVVAYVEATETLIDELEEPATSPRSLDSSGDLAWVIGTPDDDPGCQAGDG